MHAVWATKYRNQFINLEIERDIHLLIRDKFKEAGCFILNVKGMPDHVHCLFELKRHQSIADIIKHVKGGTTFEINNRMQLEYNFQWQRGYSVFSVSPFNMDMVYKYIARQKEHHRTKNIIQLFEEYP